jgi:hypothetical protein
MTLIPKRAREVFAGTAIGVGEKHHAMAKLELGARIEPRISVVMAASGDRVDEVGGCLAREWRTMGILSSQEADPASLIGCCFTTSKPM